MAFLVYYYPIVSEVFIMNAAAGLARSGCTVDIIPVLGLAAENGARHSVQDELETNERIRISPPLFPHQPRRRALAAPAVLGRMLLSGDMRGVRALLPSVLGTEALSLRPLMLARALRQAGEYDIVHCQFASLAPLALALRRAGLVRGRVVVHFRGHDITEYVRTNGEDVYREVFTEADWFIANCEHFRNRAVQLGCNACRVSVATSGSDVSQFPFAVRKPPDGRPTRILGVGRLVEKKGFVLAIEAVRRLRQDGLDVHLDIIGEGPLRPALEAAIAERDLGEHIRLLGALPHQEVAARLLQAHIFVAPCIRAASGDEDAPVNTIKEAMATGAPVVASRHGGIPEIVRHGVNGFLCDENDVADLARALKDIIAAPHLWEAVGRAGRKTVEAEHCLEISTAQFLRAYASALARPPQPATRRRAWPTACVQNRA